MSILPFIINDLEAHPPRLMRNFDQHFGLGLDPEDLLAQLSLTPRSFSRCPAGYVRPWRPNAAGKDTGSTVTIDKNKFQVNLDVQQFSPEEISVKVTGKDMITVEGKHEEREDEHGFISRQFTRKYVVPEGHDVEQIVSTLSSDGVLTITAPKFEKEPLEERAIPITKTGVPSKPIEKKMEDKQQ